jgi:hypothetical protein
MTRDEWHRSPKFFKLRLLENIISEMNQKSQHIAEILSLLDVEDGPFFLDAFNLTEMQLRIVKLETDKLMTRARKLCDILKPKLDES